MTLLTPRLNGLIIDNFVVGTAFCTQRMNSDAQQVSRTITRAKQDTRLNSDAVAQARSITRPTQDTRLHSDALSQSRSVTRRLDTKLNSDAVAFARSIIRAAQDTKLNSDALSQSRSITRVKQDTSLNNDAVAVSRNITRRLDTKLNAEATSHVLARTLDFEGYSADIGILVSMIDLWIDTPYAPGILQIIRRGVSIEVDS